MKELLVFIQNIVLSHLQNPSASPEFYPWQSLPSHLLDLLMGINKNNCTKFINSNNLCISKGLLVYKVDLDFPWRYQGAHREQQKHWSCIHRALSAKFYSKSAGALPMQSVWTAVTARWYSFSPGDRTGSGLYSLGWRRFLVVMRGGEPGIIAYSASANKCSG